MDYLNDMVIHIEQIAQMIDFSTRLVEQLQERPELMERYQKDVEVMREEVSLLQRDLERYFELERRLKYPVNLSLRRAYEKLKAI